MTNKRKSPPTLDQRRAQWLKGVLDVCVLASLRDREAYGYDLAQTLEQAGLGPMKGGTLYPLLRRLERDGLVEAKWRASDQGPDRKYYRLTSTGIGAADEAAKEWMRFVASVGLTIEGRAPRSTP